MQTIVLWDFAAPRDLEDAVTRFEDLVRTTESEQRKDTRPMNWKQLEFHRLSVFIMDHLDHSFTASGGNLDKTDKALMERFVRFFILKAMYMTNEDQLEYYTGILNLDLNSFANASWPQTRLGKSF